MGVIEVLPGEACLAGGHCANSGLWLRAGSTVSAQPIFPPYQEAPREFSEVLQAKQSSLTQKCCRKPTPVSIDDHRPLQP
jgi:hypothetical protein